MTSPRKYQPSVVVDARMVGEIPHGIARYVSALVSGLSSLSQGEGLPYRPVFLVSEDFRRPDFHGFEAVAISAPFLSLRELVEIPSTLKRLDARLYHSPSFSSLLVSVPPRPCCPWVVTIHDLNHLEHGSRFQRVYYRRLLRPFALSARAVVTVSEFSRGEIAAWLGCDPSRVEIAHNALTRKPVSDSEIARVLERLKLARGEYFFCLSNPKPHKNLAFLAESYSEFQAKRSDAWPLAVSVSGLPESRGVLQLGGLSDEDARALLAGAGAVVFPSLYEGFGLPPVEAAIAGSPVIVSDIPAHREALADVAREEVAWIDPRDRATLAGALEKAQGRQIRRPGPETGAKILARFSERELATRMDAIYRRSLAGAPPDMRRR